MDGLEGLSEAEVEAARVLLEEITLMEFDSVGAEPAACNPSTLSACSASSGGASARRAARPLGRPSRQVRAPARERSGFRAAHHCLRCARATQCAQSLVASRENVPPNQSSGVRASHDDGFIGVPRINARSHEFGAELRGEVSARLYDDAKLQARKRAELAERRMRELAEAEEREAAHALAARPVGCLLYTSPSPRD